MAARKTPAAGSKPDKLWRDEIRLAVHELRVSDGDEKTQKIKALRLLARRLVTKAMEGDVAALKEIGDRLDGKPAQATTLDVSVQITRIERKIVDPLVVIDATPQPAVIDGEATQVQQGDKLPLLSDT